MLIWMLRQVMAQRGIWKGTELSRLLEEKAGYHLSAPSISALLNGQPKQMKTATLDALCTALECTPNDLWVYIPEKNR
ncbi:MAG: helix-turn-helix transcriptional regulator [Thermoactinomyces sp.]